MKKAQTSNCTPLLLDELNRVRQLSLAATRQNDFRAVAQLTHEAATLNRAIRGEDGLVPGSLVALDSLARATDAGKLVFRELHLSPQSEAA